MTVYSLEYLLTQKTIRQGDHGDLKEETRSRRVWLRYEVVVEVKEEGSWRIVEVYVPA